MYTPSIVAAVETVPVAGGSLWILDPDEATLTVYRWTVDAYLELLIAESGEIVHPEPFEALPLQESALFGDVDDE